jgi:hypothetical protein
MGKTLKLRDYSMRAFFDIPAIDRKLSWFAWLLPWLYIPESLVQPNSPSAHQLKLLRERGGAIWVSWAENWTGQVFLTVFRDDKDKPTGMWRRFFQYLFCD